MTRWIAFDTETTGLVQNHSLKDDLMPEIIEFHASEFDPETGEITAELSTLIRPTRSIPDEIWRITRINDEMVADSPRFEEVAETIASFLARADLIFAHNLAFDHDMLRIEFNRRGTAFKMPAPGLCTVEQTEHLKGHRLSLSALHEHLFGKPFADAHRAGVDVHALVKCIHSLYKLGQL